MPKYLILGSYTAQGTKGVMKQGGSGRKAAVQQVLGSVGGKLEAFYFAFGDADAVVVADIPDNVTAAAISMAVNAAGLVRAKTVVLLTPEEMDQAAQKSVAYSPPDAGARKR